MLRYQEMVPDYYIEQSRDFQILCRMYDFAMNSLKYNIDSIQNLTDTRNVKDTVLPLLGDKLGIYDKEAYSNRQMLEALPIALKYKGSLKSVHILLNAFLDSMDVFDNALALYSKDEESAADISAILRRPIQPYSIVVILSTFPSLTNLHVLDTYLKMVIPSGQIIEYSFGIQEEYIDKFKYKEYTFLFYTHKETYTYEEGGEQIKITAPYISMIKNREDKYSANLFEYNNKGEKKAFTYAGTDNIGKRKEFVGDTEGSVTHTLTYSAVPVPPATAPHVYQINVDTNTGETTKTELVYNEENVYTINIPSDAVTYVEYNYNKTKEFIKKVTSDVDVNAVSLATVMSKNQFSKED